MKAIEFIKKFGLGFSKDCVDNRLFSVGGAGGLVSVPDDLKRYVDAYELVQRFGGLKEAKAVAAIDENESFLGERFGSCDELKQAIALVEEVESYDENN